MRLAGHHPTNMALHRRVLAVLGLLLQRKLEKEGGKKQGRRKKEGRREGVRKEEEGAKEGGREGARKEEEGRKEGR